MEYVASMIDRLDPESYRKETGYGVKEQRKAGPIFLKKENGGRTIEHLAEYICEQPEAQEWGITPGMAPEVSNMIIEVLSYGSPKAYMQRLLRLRRKDIISSIIVATNSISMLVMRDSRIMAIR
jgi:hypothetical protein